MYVTRALVNSDRALRRGKCGFAITESMYINQVDLGSYIIINIYSVLIISIREECDHIVDRVREYREETE